MWPAISPSELTISSIPSVFCQKPCSANSRRNCDSDITPSGKNAPRLVMVVCAS